jgi:nicotinate-nucleotide--dimethylbenzimidazole phosphoribosyltransferase
MSPDEAALAASIDAVETLGPLDPVAMVDAAAILDTLTKPPGSLGRLEDLVVQLAGITATSRPTLRDRAIVVAAADHGVVRQRVSAYPAEVTTQMVGNFLAGGAAINTLGAIVGANLTVIDVGVAGSILDASPEGGAGARLIRARVRPGTADMTVGAAMSRAEALRAIAVGLAASRSLRASGVELVAVGEMGIGNTTAASAITAAMTGLAAERVTGHGTGIDEATHAHKIEIVTRALDRHRPDPADPIGVLATVGGLEIGALVGVLIGAVGGRAPVVLDGFITGAAALLATAVAPAIAPRLIAGHRSVEPGHAIVLERLGLKPVLELDLRLGEGTGAALAITIIDAAIALRDGMATFGSARVSGRHERTTPVDR